jgi:hypothetical protein
MPEQGANRVWGAGSFTSQSDQDSYMALSDEAKAQKVLDTQEAAKLANTQRNLDVATGKKQGEMKSLNDIVADYSMQDEDIDQVVDPRRYLNALASRITHAEKQAETAQTLTKNPRAREVFLQLAGVLRKRLHSFQTQYAQQIEQQANQAAAAAAAATQPATQPTTQPTGGQ